MDTLSEEAHFICIIISLLIRDQCLKRLPHSKQIYLKQTPFWKGFLIQGSKLEITEILSLCKMTKTEKKYGNNTEVYSYTLRITAICLQLQFEYEYIEIIRIFSFNFNTKSQELCCCSNSTYKKIYPVSSMKAKYCIFSCSFFDKVIVELTVELVFYGTLLSYCRLMSANVSGLVFLRIT